MARTATLPKWPQLFARLAPALRLVHGSVDRAETLVVAVAGAGLALTVVAHTLQIGLARPLGLRKNEKPVATLSWSTDGVKHRPRDLPVWTDVVRGEPMYGRDQIFTGAGAARLEFKDQGSELEIGTGTLIVIDSGRDRSGLSLVDRVLSSVGSDAGRQDVQVRIGNRKAVLTKGTRLVVQKAASGAIDVAVVAGAVAIQNTSAGKAVVAQPNQVLTIESKAPVAAPVTVPLVPLTPADGARYWSRGTRSVKFTWRGSQDRATVEVARDAAFSTMVAAQTVTGSEAEVAVAGEGRFFWRVRGSGSAPAIPRSLVLAIEVPLTPRHPSPGQRLGTTMTAATRDSRAAVELSWLGTGEKYRVEVESAEAGRANTRVFTATVAAPPVRTAPLPPGSYRWRVWRLDGEGEAKSSEDVPFELMPVALPPPPSQVRPEAGAVLTLPRLGEPVTLTWDRPGLDTGLYQLVIARSPDGVSQRTTSVTVKGSSYPFVPKATGTYYWALRTLDDGGRATAFGALQRFDVALAELTPPTLVTPAAAQHLVSRAARGPVDFSWQSTSGNANYRVDVAEDATFQKLITSQMTGGKLGARVELPFGHTVYWRVTAEYPSGEERFARSEVRRLELDLAPPPEAPRLAAPAHQVTVMVTPTDPGVDLSWSTGAKGTTLYEWAVATDPAFHNLVASSETAATWVRVTLRPGRFHWRVRRQGADSSFSPWSEARSLSVRQQLPPPSLLGTEALSEMAHGRSKLIRIPLAWSAVPGAASYRVRIDTDDGEGAMPELSLSGRGTNLELEPGRFRVRLAAVDGRGVSSEFGAPHSLTVRRDPPLPPPNWLDDERMTKAYYRAQPPRISMAWSKIDEAQAYQAEVLSTAGQTRQSYLLATPELRQVFTAGRSLVRVRTLDTGGRPGPWSTPRTVDIIHSTTSPRPLEPLGGTVVPRDDDAVALSFRWRPADDVGDYRVVVSRDPDFRQQRPVAATSDSEAELTLSDGGRYYWYVEGRSRPERLAVRSATQSFTLGEFVNPTPWRTGSASVWTLSAGGEARLVEFNYDGSVSADAIAATGGYEGRMGVLSVAYAPRPSYGVEGRAASGSIIVPGAASAVSSTPTATELLLSGYYRWMLRALGPWAVETRAHIGRESVFLVSSGGNPGPKVHRFDVNEAGLGLATAYSLSETNAVGLHGDALVPFGSSDGEKISGLHGALTVDWRHRPEPTSPLEMTVGTGLGLAQYRLLQSDGSAATLSNQSYHIGLGLGWSL